MAEQNISLLEYFGRAAVDMILINHFRHTYDIEFMIHEDRLDVVCSPTDIITWDYCDDTGTLSDHDKFIKKLNHGTTRRFLVILLTLHKTHQNVIILDNKLKVVHFFEPNLVSNEDNPVYDRTRDYFTQLITEQKPYKSYTKGLRWTNLHHIYRSIGQFYPELHKVFYEKGGCVPCCWYYIFKVVREEDISKGDWFDMLQVLLRFTTHFKGYELEIHSRNMQIDTIRNLLVC
jgi:hypothetical protein